MNKLMTILAFIFTLILSGNSYANNSLDVLITDEPPTDQFNVGGRYYRGDGVTQDYKEAVKWFKLAAEQGVAGAKHSLGIMYLNGLGVIQDKNKAKQFFKDACANGYALGCENYQMLD